MYGTTVLTPAADIYSLAKTTYMLLTGEAPRRFSQKQITSLPEEFSGYEWSAYVLRVLERATQRNPESRQQTVEEFWREIKDATMAKTRPLKPDDTGEVSAAANTSSSGFTTTPPPAPTFDRGTRAATDSATTPCAMPFHCNRGRSSVRPTQPPASSRCEPMTASMSVSRCNGSSRTSSAKRWSRPARFTRQFLRTESGAAPNAIPHAYPFARLISVRSATSSLRAAAAASRSMVR